MSQSFGEFIKGRLIEEKLCQPEWFEGCSIEYLESAMVAQDVKRLPKVYREFMQVQGKSGLGHNFYGGSDWNCDVIQTLKENLLFNIKTYDADFDVPDDIFVFFAHQDYEFQYFRTAFESEDPPVYRYIVGDGDDSLVAKSMSAYYLAIIEHLISVRKQLTGKKS